MGKIGKRIYNRPIAERVLREGAGMVRYEDECVGCSSMGLHCLGRSCRNRNVPHLYCDKCGDEEKLYEFEGRELCISCIENELQEVAV